jgi:hypothetical protein
MMGLGSNDCFVTATLFKNRGHGYDFASSVSHPRSNSVELLVYDDMCTILRVLVLYYRSLGTAPTLIRKG